MSGSDGIPDWWRLAYFDHAVGQSDDKSNGDDDADGDGQTNFQEFMAGTSPVDSASLFAISKIEAAGTDIQISWRAISGKTYHLQRAPSPDTGAAWTDVGSPVTANSSTATATDPGAAIDPLHFYRVIVP